MSRASVYAIGTAWGEPIKIGVAKDVQSRFATLQAGNPANLRVLWSMVCETPFVVEARLHAALKDRRIRGEWFSSEGMDAAAITALIEVAPADDRRKPDAFSLACQAAVLWMIDAEARRAGVSKAAALRELSLRHAGLSEGLLWSFSYRPPQVADTEQYFSIVTALWCEAHLEPFGPLVNAPLADEVQELVERLKQSPLPDKTKRPAEYISRAERNVIAALSAARRLSTHPST